MGRRPAFSSGASPTAPTSWSARRSDPGSTKVGNEELESWLSRLLTPRIDFRIHELRLGGNRFVILEIPAASHTPVRFKESEWVRVGSYKKKLKDFPRMASFMRRINICEERGSGIDKVVHWAEVYQLPAPDFSVAHQHTRAVLFAYKRLSDMSKADRTRACYQHAALQFVSNRRMTNTSLRARFSIEPRNYSIASRIIAETMEAGLVKQYDRENRSRRTKYVPYWA